MNPSGNTILITGGTSGIGLGLAQRFHQAGNKVIVAGRRRELLSEITAQHAGMKSIVLDVTDPSSIGECLATVTKTYPDVNVLVNNAGIMLPEDISDPQHLEHSEATIETNLLGPIRMLSAFVPFLIGQDNAVIVNVSSGLAFVPLAMTPTYCATKAALHSYSQSLRVQLAAKGVDVIELIRPAVQTDLMDLADSPYAMALPQFLNEVMDILRAEPEATEICVENVKMFRFAEATGQHSQVLAMLSAVR